ncbi:MAG TPA: acyl carrier protein, partial [Micromonosporaceae bacterium]|nr:acyl carrier protein [Micromonosporaceae bacterium]
MDGHQEKIKEIVCAVLEIDAEAITGVSLFKEDHGADSLRAIEILAMLEKTFGVDIDQAELSRMVNLDGVYQVVAEAASR